MQKLDPLQVARMFLLHAEIEGMELVNIKLQKLVFLANAIYVSLFHKSLVKEVPVFGRYGPIFPFFYKKLIMYGTGVVDLESFGRIDYNKEIMFGCQKDVIKLTWMVFKDMSSLEIAVYTINKVKYKGVNWSNDEQISNEYLIEKFKNFPELILKKEKPKKFRK